MLIGIPKFFQKKYQGWARSLIRIFHALCDALSQGGRMNWIIMRQLYVARRTDSRAAVGRESVASVHIAKGKRYLSYNCRGLYIYSLTKHFTQGTQTYPWPTWVGPDDERFRRDCKVRDYTHAPSRTPPASSTRLYTISSQERLFESLSCGSNAAQNSSSSMTLR